MNSASYTYPPSRGIIALCKQEPIADIGRLASTTYTTPFVSGYVQTSSEEERIAYAMGVAVVRGVALANLSLGPSSSAPSGGGKATKETAGSLAKKAAYITKGQTSKIVKSNQARVLEAYDPYTTVELKVIASSLFVCGVHGADPATRAEILRPVVIEVARRISTNLAANTSSSQPFKSE